MTDHRALHEDGSHPEVANLCRDRSEKPLMIDHVPVLVSLPELATVASQRASEKESLRSQTGRLRTLNWRRVSVGVGGKVVVAGFLLALMMMTYWGLSGGMSQFPGPDAEKTTVEDRSRAEPILADPTRVILADEFLTEPEAAERWHASGPEERVPQQVADDVATPATAIARHLIVQPLEPVLTARRQQAELGITREEESQRSKSAPR